MTMMTVKMERMKDTMEAEVEERKRMKDMMMDQTATVTIKVCCMSNI